MKYNLKVFQIHKRSRWGAALGEVEPWLSALPAHPALPSSQGPRDTCFCGKPIPPFPCVHLPLLPCWSLSWPPFSPTYGTRHWDGNWTAGLLVVTEARLPTKSPGELPEKWRTKILADKSKALAGAWSQWSPPCGERGEVGYDLPGHHEGRAGSRGCLCTWVLGWQSMERVRTPRAGLKQMP